LKRNVFLSLFTFSFLMTVTLSPPPLTAETMIPDCLLSYRFGPEQFILIVEKSSQRLLVYSNHKPEPIEIFTITTGKKNGPKIEEGDMKTPEGLYFFRRVLAGEELPRVDDYGEKAFTLNYPNPIDKRENRNGSGIWLHGAFDEGKTNSPYNSRGCVVMQNGDLVKVSKYIFLDKTPICIYNKIKYDTVENIENKRDRLIDYVRQWKTNWENKNIDGYISYYDSDFTSDGMSLPQFKKHKKRLNDTYRFIKITLSDINIYGYKNYYIVMFHQLYISDRNHFYNKKIQYWRDLHDTGKIAEEYTSSLPPITKFEVTKGNYISIDQFRRDYLAQLKAETVTLVPHTVTLANISIRQKTVILSLRGGGNNTDLKVIPVLRLQGSEEFPFVSLEGIPLENGVPRDYTKGIRLDERQTEVEITKEKDSELRSLTLFLVDNRDELQQIITYFINK